MTLFLIFLIFLLALALTGAVLYFLIREGENRSKVADLQEQVREAIEKSAYLERFQHIPGIIEKSKRVNDEIHAKLQRATNEAAEILDKGWAEAQSLTARTDQECQILVSQATDQAKSIQKRALKEAGAVRDTAESEAGELRARQLVEAAREDAKLILKCVEDEVGELRAKQLIERAREEAKRIEAVVEKEMSELRVKTRIEVKEKAAKADEALSYATVEAQEIVVKAEKKAVEIGGKAYEALKRMEFYERAADAMNNVTKGYGNRYMVPAESILDTWAKEYGFHAIGEKLRVARDRIRIMEKNRTAATCEYVEASRREMAINFVVDAFNGKVDSILSRVKRDNFGTLRKEISDAFALVNFNGKPFRDAKINEEYLEARINELKYASEMQRLREQEREEQRQIRDKIREEDKAKREYERAIKQAERDENLLKKAMEELQNKFKNATLEERQKYEERLGEMAIKLAEAEERNRRAISMAQQTKQGHVYVISNIGSFGDDVYKIGLTRRLEPLDRVRELGDASVPFPFDVHAMIQSDDAPALEHSLHKLFLQDQVNKVNPRKEFFRVRISDIKKAIEELKIDVRWTLAAEARDYRETLALEEALKNDPNYRKRWVDRQLEMELKVESEDESDEFEDAHALADVEVDG